MRILSGMQSSGKLHIGNYFGALRQFLDLQNKGEALFFIANHHAKNGLARRKGLILFDLTKKVLVFHKVGCP